MNVEPSLWCSGGRLPGAVPTLREEKPSPRALCTTEGKHHMEKPKPRIAIVDDDASVCKAVKRLICSAGMNATAFISTDDFLAAIENQEPDCLVLDVKMPGINGLDLQDRLVAAGSRLPIVFITADESLEARERALRGGAIAFLRKPYDHQSLLEAIWSALRQSGGLLAAAV
jgi:FixJ family two-component response regulator